MIARPSRRGLLQGAAVWAACAAMEAAPPRRAWAQPVFLNDPFQLGVASGDPTADGFVIWTRLAPDPFDPEALPGEAIPVAWDVSVDDRFRTVVAGGTVYARPALAHSVHVDVRNLQPDRPYFYRFRCGGAESRVGRALTMPTPRQPAGRLKFAFASCQHFEQGYFTPYRDMVAQDPSLILHLGDYIYESSWGAPVRHHPGPEPVNLDEYRLYHAAYKSDADLQAAHAHCPWVFTWDDHEVDNDYAGFLSEQNDDPAVFARRRAAAYQAYYEHMPLRPYVRPSGGDFIQGNMHLFQYLPYGDLVGFHILDLRQYRSDQACQTPERFGGRVVDYAQCPEIADEARTMLGREQEFWLGLGLRRSTARWNVLAQSLMLAGYDQLVGPGFGAYTDNWGGYPAARRRILDAIKQHRPGNVVSIGGDIHGFFISDVKDNDADPASETLMTEFVGTSISSESFMTEQFTSFLPENPHIRFFDDRVRGYVLCDVTPDQWRADLRIVDNVRVREGRFSTLKSFVVESGRAAVQAA